MFGFAIKELTEVAKALADKVPDFSGRELPNKQALLKFSLSDSTNHEKSVVDRIPDFREKVYSGGSENKQPSLERAGESGVNDEIKSTLQEKAGHQVLNAEVLQQGDRRNATLPKEIGTNGEKQGEWSGERGNSDWQPADELVPQKNNPENKNWKQIKKNHDFNEITFKKDEPDFSEVSEACVQIDDFSSDRSANFTQADEALAGKWSQEGKDGKEWSADEVKTYRKENGMSWHERSDQETMDLVPSIVHGNIPHSGGISAAKIGGN